MVASERRGKFICLARDCSALFVTDVLSFTIPVGIVIKNSSVCAPFKISSSPFLHHSFSFDALSGYQRVVDFIAARRWVCIRITSSVFLLTVVMQFVRSLLIEMPRMLYLELR